ncbi:MAG: PorP/SprF family type IX secretion system membrane protein [Bacteroidia bacterium]
MKCFIKIFLLSFYLSKFMVAQQTTQYTQFLFNKGGYNPAANGNSLLTEFEVVFGGRTQWIGLSNNPKSAFINGHYVFLPQRAYRGWHSVGAYVEQDHAGIFIDNGMYLSYVYHLLVSRGAVLSAGVYAGAKQFRLNSSFLDKNDPVIGSSSRSFFAYPDIVPGIRYQTKKTYIELSIWQLSIFKQKGYFSSKQIGSPSLLPVHYIFGFGRKIKLPLDNNLYAAINIRGNYKEIPNFELCLMNYWYNRFAYGISLRDRNFLCGIYQIRIINNLVVGFAYDLAISKFFRAATNTVEVMVGISPIFGTSGKTKMRSAVDDCTF